MSKASGKPKAVTVRPGAAYDRVLAGMVELLSSARRAAGRSVNLVMTGTYWEMGRKIVEVEQGGKGRAKYGEGILERLSADLTERFGRGFGAENLRLMRRFYLAYSAVSISHTLSGKSGANQPVLPSGSIRQISKTLFWKSEIVPKGQILSDPSGLALLGQRFPLPWSAYLRLLSVDDADARRFYEDEALRCGWSVRQLDRQIATLFYERTLLSRNKAAMLRKGEKPLPADIITPEQEIKDPFVLEFLDLKDEYSESDLEEALIVKLESFLLELGGDFAFVARQRRLRIGGEWYRIDLLFFHRRLRCLVVIDLKVDKLTHADAGQMHLYLNYARENWTHPGENLPANLLQAQRDYFGAHTYERTDKPAGQWFHTNWTGTGGNITASTYNA